MSDKGIQLAAEAFSFLQEQRRKVLEEASKDLNHQDFALAQMLEEGKNAMKKKFCRITVEGNRT